MNKTPVMLVASLNIQRGGVTKATMKRANLLAKKYREVIIVTFDYQQFYQYIIKGLYEKKILAKNVKVINFFEDMKPKRKGISKVSKNSNLVKEKGYIEFQDNKKINEPSYRYYKDGFYVKYKRFNQDGTLKFIDRMSHNGYRISREEYDGRGVLTRVRHMDSVTNNPRLDRYMDDQGDCFLTVHVNPNNEKEGRCSLFSTVPEAFDKLHELKNKWLNAYLGKIKYPVVMCELRRLDGLLSGITHDNVTKVEVIHNNHLEDPFNDIKKIKKSYKKLFEQIDRFDKVVFLTNEQKRDVEAVYGKNQKFTIIPHACEKSNIKRGKQKGASYDPKLAITLARYHKDKRIDDALYAFKHVVDNIPDAKYYIYGKGSLKKELQTLINGLGLKNNVFLKPYTTEAYETYRNAACSILTSRQEAFAMVLIESMSVGTPVVSYDIKYGPRDIIEDGVNGYLVENGNKQELADRIMNVMNSDDLRESLSENALDVQNIFNEEMFRKKWTDLIEANH